ncbi:hypothetical protein FOL47_006354, partial [Perkinsus chesapeaki]
GGNQNVPHHHDDDASSNDADSVVAASEDSDDAAPQRLSNKYLKWQYGWRAFLTHFILTANNLRELEQRLAYVPEAYSSLWGAQFLQKLATRNRISAGQFHNAVQTIKRKVVDITSDIQTFNDN